MSRLARKPLANTMIRINVAACLSILEVVFESCVANDGNRYPWVPTPHIVHAKESAIICTFLWSISNIRNTLDSLGVTVYSGKRTNFYLFYKWAVKNSVFTVKGTAQHEHVIAERNYVYFDNYWFQDRIHHTHNQNDCVPTVHIKPGITTNCYSFLIEIYVRARAKPKSRADICGSANLSNHENSVSDETTGEAEWAARTALKAVAANIQSRKLKVTCSDFRGLKGH
jgi:hypothetical protein